MAEQTTTTKQAAVWNPPRLRRIGGNVDTESGNKVRQTVDDVYEGSHDNNTFGYRMPRSGEPQRYHPQGGPL